MEKKEKRTRYPKNKRKKCKKSKKGEGAYEGRITQISNTKV